MDKVFAGHDASSSYLFPLSGHSDEWSGAICYDFNRPARNGFVPNRKAVLVYREA